MDISNLSRLDEEKDDIIEEEYYIDDVDSNRASSTKPLIDYSYNDNNVIANKKININSNSIAIDNKDSMNTCDILPTSSSSTSLQALLYNLHESNVKLKSSESQNEHHQKVIKNFNDNEKKLRSENSKLVHILAKKDQDILLLEKKLQQIVSIEYPNTSRSQQLNKEISIDELRGRLLCSADAKIGELMEALEKTKQVLKEQELQLSEKIVKHKSDKDSLKKELKKMSDQLAQRAVLYSAQERRWHDNNRYQDSNNLEKDNELVRLRARLQQLEGQFEKADRERIEGILLHRQYQTEKSMLQSQLVDAQERISNIDAELGMASSRNITLQNTIDRLKGSDIEALERDLTAEVENIKEEARAREVILKRQVDEARAGLTNETENREKLLDQIVSLRAELDEKNILLRQVSENGYSTLQNTTFSRDMNQDIVRVNDSPIQNISSSCGESDGSVYSNFDVIIETHESQELDNSKFAAMFDLSMSFSEMSVLTDLEHQIKSNAQKNDSANSTNSHSTRYDDCSTSNDSFYEEETLTNPKNNNGVEVGFLLGGANANANSIGKSSSDSTNPQMNKTFNDTVLISQDDEVSILKNELNSMKVREKYLIKTLKVQGSKLALVLKRASEMGPSNYANNTTLSLSSNTDNKSHASNESTSVHNAELENLKNVVKEKDHTISMLTIQEEVLTEQLKGYKEELVLFEEQIKQNKEVGLYQAKEMYQTKFSDFENRVIEYEAKVENYENQITQLQRQLSETCDKLKDADLNSNKSNELLDSNNKLLEELDSTKKDLDKAVASCAEAESKLKSLQSKYELTSSLSSSSLTKVTEQLVSVTQELEASRIEIANTKAELELTRATISEHEAKLLSTSLSSSSVNGDNKRLTDENIRLHSFVREFVETEKSLNLEIFGLQSENDKLKEAIRNKSDSKNTYEDAEYTNKIILQIEEYWMEQARLLKEEIESLTSNLKKTKQDNIKDNERMLATYEELNNKITQVLLFLYLSKLISNLNH